MESSRGLALCRSVGVPEERPGEAIGEGAASAIDLSIEGIMGENLRFKSCGRIRVPREPREDVGSGAVRTPAY